MSSAASRAPRARPALKRGRALLAAGKAILLAPFTARTWRSFAYVFTGAFVALPMFVLALAGVVFSVLSLLTVGLPFLVGVLALLRLTPRYFRGPARGLLGWGWPSPPRLRPRGGRYRWGRAVLSDATAWRALLYCFLKFPLVLAVAYLASVAVVIGVLAVTFPAWWFHQPQWLSTDTEKWSRSWLLAAQGLGVLLVLPWFVRLYLLLDRALVRALLEPTGAALRVAELERGRDVLAADAAARLRRVERDLHDGTQARLVTLGVALSRIEHRVDDEQVRSLVSGARETVTEALTELRDIVRGIHPPALDDGLPTVLATVAARNAIPTEVDVRVAGQPSDATATTIYFTVLELLTNATKHSGANRVHIRVSEELGSVRLTVRDNGRGGAQAAPGGGLEGLRRRAEALDGTLAVSSPPGGPTVVTMMLPGRY